MPKIHYRSSEEIELIRLSCQLVSKTLGEIAKLIVPRVKTVELNCLAEIFIHDYGDIPAFLNYSVFPYSLCISLNNQIVHVFPGKYELLPGDLLSIDCGVVMNKFYGDFAYTFSVGESKEDKKMLMKVTQ